MTTVALQEIEERILRFVRLNSGTPLPFVIEAIHEVRPYGHRDPEIERPQKERIRRRVYALESAGRLRLERIRARERVRPLAVLVYPEETTPHKTL